MLTKAKSRENSPTAQKALFEKRMFGSVSHGTTGYDQIYN